MKGNNMEGNGLNFDEVAGEYPETAEIVQAGQVYDLDLIRPKFDDFKREAAKISLHVKELTVKDQESLTVAVTWGGVAKKVSKAVNLKRKEIIAEPSEFVKGVNGLCKMITDSLDDAERIAKQKISRYQSQLELERRERERKAKEETEALQRKLQAEAAEANRKALEEARKRAEEEARVKREKEETEAKERGAKAAELKALAEKAEKERLEAIQIAEAWAAKNTVQAPTVIAPVVQESPKVTRTESGSAFSKKPWVFAVTDFGLVPREYLCIDMGKIRDAVRMGVREIAGVTIYQEMQINFRT